MADDKLAIKISRLATGITAFAINPGMDIESVDSTVEIIDKLDIPVVQVVGGHGRSIEVLVAHGAGVDLDDSDKKYLLYADKVAEVLERRKYDGIVCGFHGQGSNAHMPSDDEKVAKTGYDRNIAIIEFANRAKAKKVVGPTLVEHKVLEGKPLVEIVSYVQDLAAHAAEYDITLCFEMIRGLETYAGNSVDTMSRFLDKVNRDNVKAHWDLAHAGIHEQKYGPLGSLIVLHRRGHHGHTHLGPTDRGAISYKFVKDASEILYTAQAIGIEVNANIECFHYGFWGAVGREDTVGARDMTPEQRDKLAFKEARQYIDFMRPFFETKENRSA